MAKLNGQWRLNDSVSFKEVGTQNEAASQSASASPFVGHWQGSSDGDEMYLNVTKEGDTYKMDVDSTGGIAVEGTFVGQTMGNGQLSMDPQGCGDMYYLEDSDQLQWCGVTFTRIS